MTPLSVPFPNCSSFLTEGVVLVINFIVDTVWTKGPSSNPGPLDVCPPKGLHDGLSCGSPFILFGLVRPPLQPDVVSVRFRNGLGCLLRSRPYREVSEGFNFVPSRKFRRGKENVLGQ